MPSSSLTLVASMQEVKNIPYHVSITGYNGLIPDSSLRNASVASTVSENA
jgi:hypothetical protein